MRQRWPSGRGDESRFGPNRGRAGGEPSERRGEVLAAAGRPPLLLAQRYPLAHLRLATRHADHAVGAYPSPGPPNRGNRRVGSFQSCYGRAAYDATAEISWCLAEAFRGPGRGKSPVAHGLARAPGLGIRTLPGYLSARNEPRLRLFRACGMAGLAHLPNIECR